jgi:ArsR family transcriptional regulator
LAKKPAPLSLEEAAQVFALLGDRARLRILRLLSGQGDQAVSAISAALGLSQPTTSHHLTLLRMGGLVAYRRRGQRNHYFLSSDVVAEVLKLIRPDEAEDGRDGNA